MPLSATRLIEPSRALGYNDLYLDFVSGLPKARHFYTGSSLRDTADRLDAIPYDRDRLAEILRAQNTTWGAGEATLANIERLRDPRAVCVFAGQQPGILTGPLLVILKALGIIKAAKAYSGELGRPVIPVFWIAGDDHDFDEANHTFVLDRTTAEPVKIAYPTPPEQPVPTAEIRFSDAAALEAMKANLREVLGSSEFTPDLYALIDRCYTPEDTLVSGFAKFLLALLGAHGLVVFSPADAQAKGMAAPLFEQILSRQEEMHRIVAATTAEISGLGYHVQVEKDDRAAYLFCNLEGRTPVMRSADGSFAVGERRFTREELAALVRKSPELFSPDVITRPVMQSWLFPALSQKGGPSEIAYLAQMDRIFALFERVAPCQAARPGATFVERHNEKVLQQYGIRFEELTGDIEQVVNRVLAQSFPTDLEQEAAHLHEKIEQGFRQFTERSIGFDKQLEAVANTTYGKIDFAIKQFEAKVFASHKRRSGETREKIYRLRHALYPNRGLQERTINVTYFLAKYGFGFIEYMYEHLESEEQAHQLISLSDYRS